VNKNVLTAERLREIRRIAHKEAEPLCKTDPVRVELGRMLLELLAHMERERKPDGS